MSDTLDGVKNAVVGFSRSVAKTSGEVLKTTKLNMAISGEENALRGLINDMGKIVRDMYIDGDFISDKIDELNHKADAIERKIVVLKDQVKDIKSPKVEREPNEQRVRRERDDYDERPMERERTVTPAERERTVTPVERQKRVCRVCGAAAAEGERFCLVCGRSLS